jgi:RNA polymerase sigma-70 factor (ECF subfamily)
MMDEASRQTTEREVRALCGRGDHDGAATLAVRRYGPEILGFLVAVHRGGDDANDAFSAFAEALWKGMPRFAWESTLRTWAYAIARNVSRTHRRDAGRRAKRLVAGESGLDSIVQSVRTETLAYLRTDRRTRLEALRDQLPPDDRMLLVLRVNRKLGWNELARVLSGQEDAGKDFDLLREAARLRKRFQIVKDRLREMAKREGLVE